jgi:radical SAM superfamily enzyme YgiQ (UPF0313 family)
LSHTAGVPVVLTADQTLMARHQLLLDGMLAASQTTSSPIGLLAPLLLPAGPHPGGRALVAPLGLRRVEAALLRDGFAPDEVAVGDEAHLAGLIGPETKLVAIGTGEPSGLGMSSSTMTAVSGGRIWPQALFERVRRRVLHLVRATGSRAKLVVGGPGAWQLAQDPAALAALGIDHVVGGYCEANLAELFRQVMAGADLPVLLSGQAPRPEDIPPIRGASTMGVIELSRGCGLGCGFCTLATVPMGHLPLETILADARTNLASGNPNLALLSEDFLRYGGQGVRCQPETLLGLAAQLRALPGAKLLQVDHVNVASVAQYDDGQLRELHDLLSGAPEGLCWVNIGVETASGRLLQALGGKPKMAGVAPEAWGEFAAQQLRRLCAAGYLPLVSLVLAAPAETPEDLAATLAWVRSLQGLRLTIFPVLYAPVDGSAPPTPQSLTRLQWQLLREAYEFNFRHMPGLYWDNQGRGGVSPAKRLLFQTTGHGQVAQWRYLMAKHQRRARA